MAWTSSLVSGKTTASGSAWRMMRLATGVVFADGGSGRQVGAGHGAELLEKRFGRSHGCYRTAGSSIVIVPLPASISTFAPTGSVHCGVW